MKATKILVAFFWLPVIAAGCNGDGARTCEAYWTEINECVRDHEPEGYEGPCVYVLPEYFPGSYSCEGARDTAAFAEYCAGEDTITDRELLRGCLDECRNEPDASDPRQYFESAARIAVCLGLEGWVGEVRWIPEWISMKAGERREVRLRTQHSPPFPVAFELSVPEADEGAISFEPGAAVFVPGSHFVSVTVTAEENVSTVLSAVYDDNSHEYYQADLPVLVTDEGYDCNGSVEGLVGPGGKLEAAESPGTAGLAGSFIEFPPDESLGRIDASLSCAGDIVTGDHVPIGPAVEFGPATLRSTREVTLGIPLNPAMIHEEAALGQVEVFYTGPSVSARRVLVANKWVDLDGSTAILRFMTPRFGTYQAGINTMAGKRSMTRRFTYRGITGVSMGASGAALIGFRNHEEFDFICPLGGPANWTAMLDYMHRYHLGGFCTAMDEEGEIGEHCPVPPPSAMFEFTQEYEHWFYPDGWDGQGGTFNRDDYCKIFRDLTKAFGNAAFYNLGSAYLPPGLTEEWLKKKPEEKCGTGGVVRLEEFFDRRYNPDGAFPVITFCDGAEWRDAEGERDIGRWDPEGDQFVPVDIALAVDVNENGRRDAGEPVISQPYEPYEDVGPDGISSEMEDGYHPVENPDPAQDDYNYQFNPGGTEENGLHDEGEPYLDYGLDGVQGTLQQSEGGYDWGEGNGAFDYNPNVVNFFEHDAYHIIRGMGDDDLARIDVMADAGIRDLFDFAPGINGIGGAIHERGGEVNMWRNYASLYGSDEEDRYDSTRVDYEGVAGRNFVMLYGDPDASEEALVRGDGGHVGTPAQLLNRLMTITMAMSARWPGGDRTIAMQSLDTELDTFDFYAADRESQVSIFLPPGYYNEDNFDVYYPVVYFLHGYGQEPQDLILSAIIFANNMISNLIHEEERMQKVIMVFPDGRCRFSEEDEEWQRECLKGGFYADSLWEIDSVRGPQMETIFLELMEYIDAEYRTKPEEELTVYY